jgi:hypothetical protein
MVEDSFKFTGNIRLMVDKKDIGEMAVKTNNGGELLIYIGLWNKGVCLAFKDLEAAIRFIDKVNNLINAIQIERDL